MAMRSEDSMLGRDSVCSGVLPRICTARVLGVRAAGAGRGCAPCSDLPFGAKTGAVSKDPFPADCSVRQAAQ